MIQVIIQGKGERTVAAVRQSVKTQTRHAIVLSEPTKRHEWTLFLAGDVFLRPTAIASLETFVAQAPAAWIGCTGLVLHKLWGVFLSSGNKFIRTSSLKENPPLPTLPSFVIGLQAEEQYFSALYAFGQDLVKNHLQRLELSVKHLQSLGEDPDAKVVLQGVHDALIKVNSPLAFPEKGELKEVNPSWIEEKILHYHR